MKILIVANTAWNIYNFRFGLAEAFIQGGHELLAAAPPDSYGSLLRDRGICFYPLRMNSQATDPIHDFRLFLRLFSLYRRLRPDVVLHFTIKPNIYGSVAAGLLGIPSIGNVTGLGNVFSRKSFLARFVTLLCRMAFSFSTRIFFQNGSDMELFLRNRVVRANKADRLPGSGIDTERFQPRKKLKNDRKLTFLLAARMIREKGIREYVQAAGKVRRLHRNTEFLMAGEIGSRNPSAIPEQQLRIWIRRNGVRYLGFSDRVQDLIRDADCVVLPSYYREGVPRTLLEAASMGRPIITTDSVGCRDVVDHGVNGFLVPVRDAGALAAAMARFIELDDVEKRSMADKSREKAVREFDEKIVIGKYREVIDNLAHR